MCSRCAPGSRAVTNSFVPGGSAFKFLFIFCSLLPPTSASESFLQQALPGVFLRGCSSHDPSRASSRAAPLASGWGGGRGSLAAVLPAEPRHRPSHPPAVVPPGTFLEVYTGEPRSGHFPSLHARRFCAVRV